MKNNSLLTYSLRQILKNHENNNIVFILELEF